MELNKIGKKEKKLITLNIDIDKLSYLDNLILKINNKEQQKKYNRSNIINFSIDNVIKLLENELE